MRLPSAADIEEPLWFRFLAIRAELIDEFLAEGKSCTEICDIFSMEPGQVWLISQRNGPTGPVPEDAAKAIEDHRIRVERMIREGRIK
jgi:hypothetical protein